MPWVDLHFVIVQCVILAILTFYGWTTILLVHEQDAL